MNFLESIKLAFASLLRHKLRSFLTMLGMIFGVGAVISMLSIGEGAQREALRVIDIMGIRNIIVRAKSFDDEDLKKIRESSLGLSQRNLETIREEIPDIADASARKKIKIYNVLSPYGKSDSPVIGVAPSYPGIANLHISRGRFFNEQDNAICASLCVIGSAAKRKLFGFEESINKEIKINDVWFTVIGLIEEKLFTTKEFEGVSIEDSNHDIYIPINTALSKFKFKPLEDELDELYITVKEEGKAKKMASVISNVVKRTHKDVNDFTLVIPEALLEQHQRTQQIFNIVMGCIAGISLLVGGIGIMNIMLANMLERTVEIGVRRAAGARRRDIRDQFLIEAVAISVVGGLIGICFGFALSKVVVYYTNWNNVVTSAAILLSFGVSTSVGILFGHYPARRAASLNPIDALRHE